MNNLKILLHYTKQPISEEDNHLVYRVLAKSLKLIENNINDAGGICGYELKIEFLLNKNKDDTNRISDIIKNDKKIIVSHGPCNPYKII